MQLFQATGIHLDSLVFPNYKFDLLQTLLSPHLQAIKNHKNAHQQYVDRLLKEGQISKEQIDKIHEDIHSLLQKNFETAKVRRSAGAAQANMRLLACGSEGRYICIHWLSLHLPTAALSWG